MSVSVSVQIKTCTKCGEVKLLEEFHKAKNKKNGRRPNCKNCVKEYCVKNSEKLRARTATYRAANPDHHAKYRAANSEKIKERHAKWVQANPEKIKEYEAQYRAANPEETRQRMAKYCASNPEKVNARSSKRRAIKLRAIPSWLTKEDYQVIEAIYSEAKRLEAETGIRHHVDHIHPLQGKLICGLHCPSNLQILTNTDNISKGNKFIPYVESELT